MSNNRVTPEQITSLLDGAETQEAVFWGKELVVSFKLPSGFTICGRGACVDPANFDIEIGRRVAREDAENQLWKFEGYLLQNRLYEQGVL
ncbi:Gp49 family protein [uncultured Nostoc sp.]|uniref:Gp49 family protein n=1 Tax=uncultured Nostoc sp. TaxID=340711 RepID=UPI0035CB9DC7